MPDTCPVCKRVDQGVEKSQTGVQFPEKYSCPRCGDFFLDVNLSLDPMLNRTLKNDMQRAALSHWIRTRHESMIRTPSDEQSPIVLDSATVESIIKNPAPSVTEQANKFVLWLGSSNHPPGEPVLVEPAIHQSIMGAVTPKGFLLVIDDLVHEDLLKNVTAPVDSKRNITLSCKGWQQYDRLRRGAVDSRKAFIAMQYNEPQLDEIVETVFKPAVGQTGFYLFKLPDRPQPAGLIDDRLRVEIQTSRFLVADLTHGNAGAYWEAGYAEGLGKPVIYTCEKKIFEDAESQPHFDTNHHLTILWEWDPDKRKEAGEKLKSTIRATLPAEAKLTDD